MPFKAGQVANPKGRGNGNIDKDTRLSREMITLLVQKNFTKVQKALDQLFKEDPARALDILIKLTKFSLPELKAMELTGKDGGSLNTTIIVQNKDTVDEINKLS